MSASIIRCRRGPRSEAQRRRAERLFADHVFELAQRTLELALLGDPVALAESLRRAWPVEGAAPAERPEPAARESAP
jgi:hypothetical protein